MGRKLVLKEEEEGEGLILELEDCRHEEQPQKATWYALLLRVLLWASVK
jgi:hypothetical protein